MNTNLEELEPIPHKTIIRGRVLKSENRMKMTKSKRNYSEMRWKCTQEINPHDSQDAIKTAVVKTIIENKLRPGEYFPQVFKPNTCDIWALPSVIVTIEDIEMMKNTQNPTKK